MTTLGEEPFETPRADVAAITELVVDLDGYEGPIDVLLSLARDQKVDLTKISILQLADQYLAFISAARQMRLEIAADYLVMAAWLAYLKSRLLLPEPQPEDEPSGAELAAALAFQLQRLEAMQQAGVRLMARPLLGRDVFPRGAPEGLPHSMDDALARLGKLLGKLPEWRTLMSFLPPNLRAGLVGRSAVASTFAASLELVRSGRVQLRQDVAFGPIYLRSPPEEK